MVSTLLLLISLNTGSLADPPHRDYVDRKKKVFSLTGTYIIEDEGTLIIYSQRGFYKTAHHIFFYFSETSDAPIMRLNMKNLKHVLHDPALIKRLKHDRRDLLKRDGEHMMINSIVANFSELHARQPIR